MKTLLLSVLIFLSSVSLAQNYLTNAQVFDYNVGDIIQGVGSQFRSLSPPTYRTNKIIKKVYSASLDTIYYTIIQISYSPEFLPKYPGSYSSDTIIQTVTNLNEPVKHNNSSTPRCFKLRDTVYVGFCNRLVWEKVPETDTPCFEPVLHYTWFIQGAGGPYNHLTIYGGNGGSGSYEPVYIFKYPNNSCGYYATALKNEVVSNSYIDIFPNPFHATANIKLPYCSENTHLKIIDLEGRLIKEVNNIKDETITIKREYIPSGLYILSLMQDNIFYTEKIIITDK